MNRSSRTSGSSFGLGAEKSDRKCFAILAWNLLTTPVLGRPEEYVFFKN